MKRRSEMNHLVSAAVPVLVALAGGCTTIGTGTGSTPSGPIPANLSWRGSDSVSETMNATLYDGKRYGGQFFQITKQTTIDNIGPRWSGDWYASWGRRRGWEHWDAMPTPDYSTHYTRRVVANLGTASGEHMRCKFQLAQTSGWRLSLVSDARRQ